MNKTFKRIFALFLTVVLCFSIMPMAAFATEAEPSESDVSSEIPEESTTEELSPEDDASSIAEEIFSADIPVLYARDPISSVKADLEGGNNYLTNYGVTRAAIVNELEAHEHDSYYLGTPYAGGDYQSPSGDTSYNGSAGLNCCGFVSYVLRKAGLNTSQVLDLIKRGDANYWGSGLPYDLLAGASNFYILAQQAGLTCYVYETKEEMLADGKLEKGDIIFMYWSMSPFNDGEDNHIGFFWGESSGDDILWHSSTHPGPGNQISTIAPKSSKCLYIVIKIEPMGYNVTLTKTSADASYTQGNSSYSLAGATYNVYQGNTASGVPVATFTTDANGHAELAKPLGNGVYCVKEVKAPKGYKLDENVYTFTISGSDTSLEVQDDPGSVALRLIKKDSGTGERPQGNASLAGAVYRISYQKGGRTVTQEGTSDEQGRINPRFDDIPFGKVTVQEIKAPEGYKLDTRIHEYNITAGELVTDVYEMEPDDLTEEVIRGGVTIEKRDSQTGDTPQGDASFAGISFEIVNGSENPVIVNGKNCASGSVAMTITTDNSGRATTGPNALPFGEYIVRETSTNNSMLKTFTEEIHVTIDEDGKIYSFTAENDVVRGGISIEKRDTQTSTTPQGNADFSGITFEIVNRSANAVVVEGQTYAPGAVVTTLTTDSEGKASTADDALPFGRFEVREATTNESMLLTFPSQMVTVSENGKVYPVVAENDVVRGGLSLKKHDSITGSTPQGDADFAGITFQIINKSRNPVIVNGTSYAPDEVVLELVTDVEGKARTAEDALPFGEYLLHESATNESMLNTASDQTVIVSKHHKVYDFVAENEVVRGGVLIEKRDLESGLLTPLGGASLDGTLFEITNKSKNPVYVDGALYDPESVCLTIEVKDGIAKSDVRALPYGTYSMVESKPGTGYLWTDKKVRDFTVFNASALAGRAVVVFETLYQDGKEVASHADIDDKGQTVGFRNPKIGTTATVDGEKTADPLGEVTIVDTVTYIGLTAGKEYTVKGLLMDKATGEKLSIDGKEITAEATFTAPKSEGSIDIPFTFDASGLAGKSVVVFESLYREGVELAVHTDINDEGQTIDFGKPDIKTTATINGEKTADPLGEVTLVDTVEYTGLTVGKMYNIKGVLMDKSTGEKLLVNGKEITSFAEFTAEKENGTVEVSFTFDCSGLAGKSIVVFETLYQDGLEVVVHADIEDEAQTITVNPKGGLLIKKTAEDNMVEGISFLVTGEGYAETFTTDAHGQIYIQNLKPGEYVVTEVENETTACYELEAGKTVTVTAGDEPTTVEFHNKLRRGSLQIIKVESGTDTRLEGATFCVKDEDGQVVAEGKTDKNGELSFDDLPWGTYE